MLPTFVIGLREGLEAALIVGFVAAFLRRTGRADLLRWVLLGVVAAVVLCAGIGVALRIYSQSLPQRQQEGLETVIGAVAVGMVTYMVVWMRRNSRSLKGTLEGAAAQALKAGSGMALVAMAFLAVLREGVETVVFLLAAFNESASGASSGLGALIGILVAIALGYGIYRGGVTINLSRFFRATGAVLVLVAAGLVVNALHTAHEAGWLNSGQQQTLDLTALVRPGSVQASLITGMLGIQPRPVLIEVVGWLAYLVPVGLYIVWPPGRGLHRAARVRGAAALAALAGIAAVALAVLAPSAVAAAATRSGALSADVTSTGTGRATLVVTAPGGTRQTVTATETGTAVRDGLGVGVYTVTTALPAGATSTTDVAGVARLNDGRLPIGLRPTGAGTLTITRSAALTATFLVDPTAQRVVDASWVRTDTPVVTTASGAAFPLTASASTTAFTPADVAAAAAAARHDRARLDDGQLMTDVARVLAAVCVVLLLAGGYDLRAGRRATAAPRVGPGPVRETVRA